MFASFSKLCFLSVLYLRMRVLFQTSATFQIRLQVKIITFVKIMTCPIFFGRLVVFCVQAVLISFLNAYRSSEVDRINCFVIFCETCNWKKTMFSFASFVEDFLLKVSCRRASRPSYYAFRCVQILSGGKFFFKNFVESPQFC